MKECPHVNHLDGRMVSDVNHTVRDILLTSVNEVRCVVVQTCPVSFTPGIVVGAHVKYWVYKYRRPPLEGAGLGIGAVTFSPTPQNVERNILEYIDHDKSTVFLCYQLDNR